MAKAISVGARRIDAGLRHLLPDGTVFTGMERNSCAIRPLGKHGIPRPVFPITGGLTINRFTPIDGLGNRYDSTVDNTLGFNSTTLSWTQHWGGDWKNWSTNLTLGSAPQATKSRISFKINLCINFADFRPFRP